MRLRTRIFLTLAAVLALSFGVAVWWTESGLERRLEGLAARELERTARLLVERSADEPFTDELADRLGRSAGLRVTLIGPDGRVLGDSEVPARRLPQLEDHAIRPEVRAALDGSVGVSHRPSASVARRLLYVALPHPQGALRVAVPVDAVDTTLVRTRRLEILGAALGLLLAYLLSRWLGRQVDVPVARMRESVRAIERGEFQQRPLPRDADSLGELDRAIHQLAARLRSQVGEIRAEKEDLDALFKSLEDGLAVVGQDGTVTRANPAFARWAGRRRVVGERFSTLFRSPRIAGALERARAGERDTQELTLGDRTLLLSVQPHGGAALVVFRDLTQLRKLEGVRRDFVANVSHELKTPLTSVVGYAEALAAGELERAQAAEFGERILANATRMRRLVDDLLDLALVESGGWRPRPEPLDVEHAARAVWSSLEPLGEGRGLSLRVEAEEDLPVHADPDAFRQILRNLLDNAVKYAPEGSEIVLSGRRENGLTRLEVRDSGPGIPMAHHSRVFERFYRVDPARSREAGGTGLGLAIVKHLVLGHGGEVGIESELGRGTSVWFTLPATPRSSSSPPLPDRYPPVTAR